MTEGPATGPAATGAETDAGTEPDPRASGGLPRLATATGDRETTVLVAGFVAVLAVASRTALSVLGNLPFEPLVASPPVRAAVTIAASFALGLALVVVAVASDRSTVLVGLLFVGVFGAIGSIAPSATLPAAGGVTAGSAVALLGPSFRGQGRRTEPGGRTGYRRVLAAGFVAAVAVSLATAVGVLDGDLRSLGTVCALGAVAATGPLAGRDPIALGAGALVLAAVLFVGATSPFVVGSALLVGFVVAGVPYALVALAAGGGVAVTVGGLRSGEYLLATGGCLLLLAGVPVTFPRAMAVLLGATLVLLDVGTPVEAAGSGRVAA